MARKRTQKILARQLALDYFQKPFWFRSWRRGLTWGCFGVGLVWLGFLAVRRDDRVYSSGPTSLSHRAIESDCAKCHSSFNSTPDEKCVACHSDQQAPHHDNQTATPLCATCHLEHRGRAELANVTDRLCTTCHAELRTKEGTKTDVAAHVAAFDADHHPDFAALKPGVVDTATIRLNHATHLRLSKDDPKLTLIAAKRSLPLQCGDCHRPDESGRHFQPITFERVCQAGCHSLTFDESRPSSEAPHDHPERVRGFLQSFYASTAKSNAAGESASDVAARVTQAERVLYEARCVQCHRDGLTRPSHAGGLYEIAPTNSPEQRKRWFADVRRSIPSDSEARSAADSGSDSTMWQPRGWLTHASFDHAAHRAVRCDACHAKVAESKETADVLLPAIASCYSCHKTDGGARTECGECHVYHDRSRYQERGGTLGLGFGTVLDEVGDPRR